MVSAIAAGREDEVTINSVIAVIAFLTASAALAAVTGAGNSQAPKAAASDAASTNQPLMIVQNPDGTFTIQKGSPKGEPKDAKAKNGLVIPPQVVVPMIPAPKRK
jgi:hypothetical protein